MRRALILEQFPCGCEIEVAVVVVVRPCSLVGWWKSGKLGRGSHVLYHELSIVAKQHGVVLAPKRRNAVDRCKEQVEISVIVIVGYARRSV